MRCNLLNGYRKLLKSHIVNLADCARASISDADVTHPSGTKYPARAVVNCDTGYEMVGTGFLECLETGLWSTESQCVIRGMPLWNMGSFIFLLTKIFSGKFKQ